MESAGTAARLSSDGEPRQGKALNGRMRARTHTHTHKSAHILTTKYNNMIGQAVQVSTSAGRQTCTYRAREEIKSEFVHRFVMVLKNTGLLQGGGKGPGWTLHVCSTMIGTKAPGWAPAHVVCQGISARDRHETHHRGILASRLAHTYEVQGQLTLGGGRQAP